MLLLWQSYIEFCSNVVAKALALGSEGLPHRRGRPVARRSEIICWTWSLHCLRYMVARDFSGELAGQAVGHKFCQRQQSCKLATHVSLTL